MLRSGYFQRLTRGVDMTSNVKGREQLFLGLHEAFLSFAHEKEAEPVRDDG
jgi:hypothetical protein